MDKNNEITNNELVVLIKDGFALADKQTDTKIETLAKMVANGFNSLGERIEAVRKELKGDIVLLKQGQERIEMRLNNVVYRTELDAVLDRVQILEKQMKVALKNE